VNPGKLLLDPYARAIDGELQLAEPIFGYPPGRDDTVLDDRDSAPYVPRSVVVHDPFPWGDDRSPRTPWADTVIYELHVKGFTALHPEVPPATRGSYAGLAHPAVLGHPSVARRHRRRAAPGPPLRVRAAADAARPHQLLGLQLAGLLRAALRLLVVRDPRRAGPRVQVDGAAMHSAGIEVILDVVYNHTAELDELGPTLSFRGIDNGAYYKLSARGARRYADYTGCGNTLNVRHPHVLQLIMDSLRYWVTEMHVDGFRFDLASRWRAASTTSTCCRRS
jgi:glycogen operon protein